MSYLLDSAILFVDETGKELYDAQILPRAFRAGDHISQGGEVGKPARTWVVTDAPIRHHCTTAARNGAAWLTIITIKPLE